MSSDVLPEPGEQLITAAEAGRVLGVHRTTMYHWADAGFVPCVRLPNGQRLFRRRQMEELARGIDALGEAAVPEREAS